MKNLKLRYYAENYRGVHAARKIKVYYLLNLIILNNLII